MERKENCSSEGVLYYARILFVWVCLLGNVGHAVAKRLKVEVETPGTLPELVGKKAKYKVTDLTLKGTLNGRDLCFLREMAGRDKERQSTPGRLRTLDMRGVSFARGGGGVRKTRGMARGAGRAYASALFVQRMWIGAYRFARTVGHHSGRGFGSHTNQQDRIAGKCVCGCFCLLWEQRIGGSGLPPTYESHLEGGF